MQCPGVLILQQCWYGLEVQPCPRPDLPRPRVNAEVGRVLVLQYLIMDLCTQVFI